LIFLLHPGDVEEFIKKVKNIYAKEERAATTCTPFSRFYSIGNVGTIKKALMLSGINSYSLHTVAVTGKINARFRYKITVKNSSDKNSFRVATYITMLSVYIVYSNS
jgi:hypothetical protein